MVEQAAKASAARVNAIVRIGRIESIEIPFTLVPVIPMAVVGLPVSMTQFRRRITRPIMQHVLVFTI